MTARDRIVIVVVLLAAAVAGIWFMGLSPKHKQNAELQTQIEAANQRLAAAEQKASVARRAKDRYDADYAAVAKLGKAVPKSDALPSLVYQLQAAAHDSRIDFRSVKVSAGGGTGPTAAATAPATSNGGTASGSSSSSGGTSSTPPASSTPAPATQAAAATLPPGALVGSAGFPTMPFSFVFNGSFFDMESFFAEVQRFVRVKGDRVDVRGRLLSIDGFALTSGPGGFPAVKADISATAYLLSPDDTAASATPASPSTGAASSTATPASGSAPASNGGAAASEVAR